MNGRIKRRACTAASEDLPARWRARGNSTQVPRLPGGGAPPGGAPGPEFEHPQWDVAHGGVSAREPPSCNLEGDTRQATRSSGEPGAVLTRRTSCTKIRRHSRPVPTATANRGGQVLTCMAPRIVSPISRAQAVLTALRHVTMRNTDRKRTRLNPRHSP